MMDSCKGLAKGGRVLNTTKFKQNCGFLQRASLGWTGSNTTKFKQNAGFLQRASEGRTGFKYNQI
jgi:hypothetical protein